MAVGPLAGRRIVLTRPTPGPLADRLAALGAEVVHIPLIAIGEARDDGAALAAALDRLDEFDWLVVTSANGATRVGAAARDSRVRLAAVGTATAAVLASLAERRVDLVPGVQRTAGLLAAFPPGPAKVLVAQGNLATSDVADGLRAAGCDVTTVEAYATMLVHPDETQLVLLNRADVVVLASGSAATAWTNARGTNDRPVVAIGPQTADVARSRGLRVVRVSLTPSDNDVVTAVVEALS